MCYEAKHLGDHPESVQIADFIARGYKMLWMFVLVNTAHQNILSGDPKH